MATIMIGELEIFYTEKGEGETLVIFPDQLHASHGYGDEIDHFAERFHVLAFDYPETGRSTREAKYHDEWAFDLWTFRADLACHLLMDLGIESAYAMGTFGGALAAFHFAGKLSHVQLRHQHLPRAFQNPDDGAAHKRPDDFQLDKRTLSPFSRASRTARRAARATHP